MTTPTEALKEWARAEAVKQFVRFCEGREPYSDMDWLIVDDTAGLILSGVVKGLEAAKEIAAARRDKEHNAGRFKASVGKHDWVVQFHNGAALASSEIAQETDDILKDLKERTT